MKAKLLLTLFSVVFGLGFLEIAIRIAMPEGLARPLNDRPSVIYYPGDNRINAWSKQSPDPLRIAVVGDSVTAGSGCQFYDTYSMRLEALLNHNDNQRPAMVRVWAKGGLNPTSELGYKDEILEWNPDLLIMGICLNDAEDAEKKDEINRWRLKALPPPPPPWMAKVLRFTRLGSLAYQKIANLKARKGYLKYYRRLYNPDYSGWRKFSYAMHEWQDACKSHGIPFLAVIFPLFSDVDRYPFDWVHMQIRDMIQAEGVVSLDLLETFRGLSPERLQVIPSVDAHPNEIAHRLAAETIFQYLLANGLVDIGYVPEHANTSPGRMWRIIADYISNVATVDAAKTELLKEKNDVVDE